MTYEALYAESQEAPLPVSRTFIIPRVCKHTKMPKPRIFKSGQIDPAISRGSTIWPGMTEHPLAKHCKGSPLIVVARDLNYCWTRFVIVKEMMHYFDTPLERVSSNEEFEQLLQDFTVPTPDFSEAMHSEVKAFWMALGVLCPELKRQEFGRLRESGAMTDMAIAEALRIPVLYIPLLFDPKFKSIIANLLADG